MKHQTRWTRWITRVYRLSLGFYPSAFRAQFGDEMQDVFMSKLEEPDGEHPLRLCWREFRHWPETALKAHLHARRKSMASNGFNREKPLPRKELLAAMIIFLLPLFSILAINGIDLPDWTNYIVLVLFWGSILFALGLAIAKKLPGWSLSYFGFVLMLGLIFSPILPRITEWVYPYFLKAFGARSGWPIPVSLLYAGVFEFIGVLQILLGALVFVNLLRLLPYTRTVWERIRADWTQLSFLIYGGLVFTIVLIFEEYRYDDPWKFAAWAFLAAGAWFYLRAGKEKQRILALLGGMTAAFWTVALAKWFLIPLQMWPTGYPIAPSVASRWIETVGTLFIWLFFLGILCAPALIKRTPPSPEHLTDEEQAPTSAQTA